MFGVGVGGLGLGGGSEGGRWQMGADQLSKELPIITPSAWMASGRVWDAGGPLASLR